MTRLILPLALILAILLPAPVAARQAVALESLQIDLWPEFDRPAVLVVLAGQIPPASSYPVSITVNIPAASGGPHAVAVQDEAGSLFDAPYTTATAGDQLAVTLQADRPSFHLEYYDPALTVNGADREYLFQWTTPGTVATATLRVQQPVGAGNPTSDLALTASGVGEYGLNYFTAPLGSLTAGQVVAVRLTYTKTTPGLSAETLGVGAAQAPTAPVPLPAPVPAQNSWPIVPVAAGAAGALALAAGGFFLFRSRMAAPPERNRTRRGRRSASRAEIAALVASAEPAAPRPASAPTRFCTECGQPGGAGDSFCRNCGTRLRG